MGELTNLMQDVKTPEQAEAEAEIFLSRLDELKKKEEERKQEKKEKSLVDNKVPPGKTTIQFHIQNDLLDLLDMIKLRYKISTRKQAVDKALELLSEVEPYKSQLIALRGGK